jgi:hypothetical protein
MFKNIGGDEWVTKENVVHIHYGCYSPIKKNKIMSFAGKWLELEVIMLSEIRHVQEDKYHVLSHMQNLD